MKYVLVVATLAASVALRAEAPVFSRGQHVQVKPPVPNRPAVTATVLTVVGLPGDRLSVARGALYVNDVKLEQFSQDFVRRVSAAPERVPAEVPTGHYFVMGEARINQDIREYWGQHAASSLVVAR